MQDLARNYRNNPVMLNELADKTTAVAESKVDYMSEVAKDSKQDTSEFEKDIKQQDMNCGSWQD
jgi:hypothetical protein